MPDASDAPVIWHKVAEIDELPDGRVKTVVAGRTTLALTHYEGAFGALDNHCPHQGGPLGEGSIENGLLRCPWHGYDYSPLTGTPPPTQIAGYPAGHRPLRHSYRRAELAIACGQRGVSRLRRS